MTRLCNESKLSEVQQQAIDWLVRLRSDDVSDDEMCRFADWLARDLACSDAFAEAEDLFAEMTLAAKINADEQVDDQAKLSHVQYNPEQKIKRKKNIINFLMPITTVSAVWAFAFFLFLSPQSNLLGALFSDYHTKTGEFREIKLSDGSELLLNTNSSVSVKYSNSVRQIILHRGQARFNVATDSARPFEVLARNIKVQALGTIFQVFENDFNSINIVVQKHAVTVQKTEEELTGSVTVKAGQQIQVLAESTLPRPVSADLAQTGAWQQRRLIVNDQPLSKLIAELERYRNGRIFLADNNLENLRVTGVFSLDNPEQVIHSVAQALNLKETWIGSWWVVLRQP